MTRPNLRRRLRAEVRAAADVLRHRWDPIGHGSMGLPADEYDAYAPRVVSLIEMGVSDQVIANYLEQLENTTIGVKSGRDLNAIAALLRTAVAAASVRAT